MPDLSSGDSVTLGPSELRLSYRRTDTSAGMSDAERLSVGQMIYAAEGRLRDHLSRLVTLETDRAIAALTDAATLSATATTTTIAKSLDGIRAEHQRQADVLYARLTYLEAAVARLESRPMWLVRLWRTIIK